MFGKEKLEIHISGCCEELNASETDGFCDLAQGPSGDAALELLLQLDWHD